MHKALQSLEQLAALGAVALRFVEPRQDAPMVVVVLLDQLVDVGH
jgi:hypothetical protein